MDGSRSLRDDTDRRVVTGYSNRRLNKAEKCKQLWRARGIKSKPHVQVQPTGVDVSFEIRDMRAETPLARRFRAVWRRLGGCSYREMRVLSSDRLRRR